MLPSNYQYLLTEACADNHILGTEVKSSVERMAVSLGYSE